MEGSKERNKDRQERILIKVKSIADSNPSTLWANLTATDLIDDPPPTDRIWDRIWTWIGIRES